MKNTVAGKGTAGRKERIRDVASERDAHLVIEVMGRRRESAVGPLRGGFCIKGNQDALLGTPLAR